jgi:HlyD family secretion protein
MALARRTKIGAALSLVMLLALLAWAFAPRPVEVEVAIATSGPFEMSIDEDGRTRLRERFVVSAPLAGRLARMSWHEGDAVEAGAVLATLTPVLSPMLDERTLAEQRARIEASQAAVKRAALRIDAAKIAVEQASIELRRTEQLAAQGFVAPTKVDGDRLAAQVALKELATAVESEHIAGHELQQARAALAAARGRPTPGADDPAFTVRSPVAGRVLRVLQPSEATVALGTPLLEIGDVSRLEVVAELLTSDALQAVPGSPVRIERWGGPTVLEGRVRRVEPAAFTKVSALGVEEQRVNVLIDITTPSPAWTALGDGYRVSLRVITRSEASVLLVPVSALFPLPAAAGAGTAVFVLEGGHARLRRVELGGRNAVSAWVRDGLKAGDTVIVYPPATVSDGARVRARQV